MPQADAFDAPQGGTFYGDLLQAVTEAFAGNGVLSNSDATVSAGSSGMEIDVSAAPVGIEYDGTAYTPPSTTLTVPTGPTTTTSGADDRRADIVVFDTDAGEYDAVEGAPHPNPSPPETPPNALLLAVVTVEHDGSTLTDGVIYNWRARPNEFPNDGPTPAVATGDLQDDSVTSSKVEDGAVTSPKIEDDSVTSSKVEDGSLTDADVSSSTTIDRTKIDDERITSGIHTADVTTDGEEVVFVDTSGGAVTVTLASADATEGNVVTVVDVGGGADTNQITVSAESGETVDGSTDTTVSSSWGATVVVSDGDNWFTSGGGTSSDSGGSGGSGGANMVEAGGYNIVDMTTLRANERLKVDSAELTLEKGQARPEGLTLQLVYFNRYQAITQYRPIIEDPGVKGVEDGAAFTNLANFPRTVAIVTDNGQFGAGTGTAKSYRASAETAVQGDYGMTMVNIRPNAPAHIANTATYNQQSDSNVGFYEVNSAGDTIDFDLEQVADLQDPTIVITTAWGTTDFDLVERDTGDTVVSETSGFDTDVWVVDVQDTSGKFRLTNFDDTQAAFYGYVRVFDAE